MFRIQEALSVILRHKRQWGGREERGHGGEKERRVKAERERGIRKNATKILGYNMLSQI